MKPGRRREDHIQLLAFAHESAQPGQTTFSESHCEFLAGIWETSTEAERDEARALYQIADTRHKRHL